MINRLNINRMKKLFLCLAILVLAFNNGFSQGVGDFVIDNVIYKVISFDDMTVQALGLENAQTIVTIPSTIEYGNRTFRVTGLDFQNNNDDIEVLNLSEGLEQLNLPNSKIHQLNLPSSMTLIETIKSINGFDELIIPGNVITVKKCSLPFIKYLRFEDGENELQVYDSWSSAFSYVAIDSLYFGRTWSIDYSNGEYYFHESHIKSIVIGNNVKRIPYFNDMDIEQIVLPSSIELLLENSFKNCNRLSSIVVEDRVDYLNAWNSINDWLFYNDNNVKEVYLGRDCKRLRLDLFQLNRLTLGPSVSQLFDSFYNHNYNNPIDVYGDSSFVKVCNVNPPVINSYFTNRTYIETPLYVPRGTIEQYQQADIWKNFFNIFEFDWDNPICSISLSANDYNRGTVNGQGIYSVGENVTVEAIPIGDYVFANWTENDSVVSTDASYSFVTTGNRNLVANFVYKYCPVQVFPHTCNEGVLYGEGQHFYGDTVTISAIPNDGYIFLCWLNYENPNYFEDTVSFDNPYTFVVTKSMRFYAVFSEVPDGFYSVSVLTEPSSAGIIEGEGIYLQNSEVTIKAIPNSEYSFINWTEEDAIVSSNSEYHFIIQENRNLVAHFSGLGISDIALGIAVYPNPTKGLIKIEEKEVERIEVYNAIGQLIKKTKDNVLDLSDQEAGTYIIKVITPLGTITKQIIKK